MRRYTLDRLNIGPRLIVGFAFIALSMLAADAVALWQFHVVRTQAARLNEMDQTLVAVFRVHSSLSAFSDRLEALAESEDVDRLVTEAGPLRTAVLEHIRRASTALSVPPFVQQDPTILPTLQVIQSALSSQLEGITTLAAAGDWRAVHLRASNQVRPLTSLASTLVEKVAQQAGEQQAQVVRNVRRVEDLVFVVVPLTAAVTLLIAATLGLAITRSITQPLARVVEGSKRRWRAVSSNIRCRSRGRMNSLTSGTSSMTPPAACAISTPLCKTAKIGSDVSSTPLQRMPGALCQAARLISSISVSWNFRPTSGGPPGLGLGCSPSSR